MTDYLLPPREVARLLGVNIRTICRMIDRGELPVVRVSLRSIGIPKSYVYQRFSLQPDFVATTLPDKNETGEN